MSMRAERASARLAGHAVVVPTPAPDPAPIEPVELENSAAEVRQKACPDCGAVISFYALVCQ
jgi:hypothetical protein